MTDALAKAAEQCNHNYVYMFYIHNAINIIEL